MCGVRCFTASAKPSAKQPRRKYYPISPNLCPIAAIPEKNAEKILSVKKAVVILHRFSAQKRRFRRAKAKAIDH